MSESPSGIRRVDRLTSQVEFDAMPDVCGKPLHLSSEPFPYPREGEGKAVLRGSGLVLETSEGISGESQQIPSGRKLTLPSQISQPFLSDRDCLSTFLENYTFLHRYSSSDQQKYITSIKLIMKHFERLPDELKASYYDVMILYSERDQSDAESYCQSLNNLSLENGKRVKAILYNDPKLASVNSRNLKNLEIAFERCTFTFVYLTKQFCQCEWSQMASEGCLMEAIYNKDKRWCVVPVYTVRRTKADFRIPMGLNSLKGVNFYNNDDFYRRGLQSLISGKIYKREDHEEALFIEQCKYVVQLENQLESEVRKRQQKLDEAEHQKGWPSPSSSQKEELLKNLDSQAQKDADSVVLDARQYPSGGEMSRSLSKFQSESSVHGYPSMRDSQNQHGDQPDLPMPYSIDSQESVSLGTRGSENDASLQGFTHHMNPGMHQKPTKKYLPGSEKFEEATGEKTELDKDGKVIVHHIHTHTHIYKDKEQEKSPKKNVINIYGAENVVIGDKNTVVEGATPASAMPSEKDPEMSASSTKTPSCNPNESPSLSSRQSMEGPSRQFIDGHPSSFQSSDNHDTMTKKTLCSTSDESNIEDNQMETDVKNESETSNKHLSLPASKTYYNTTTTASSSLPSTNVASSVQSNILPMVASMNVNISSTSMTSNVSSTSVPLNIPSTATVTANISSTKENISTCQPQTQSMKSMENIPNATVSMSAVSSTNRIPEHTEPVTSETNTPDAPSIRTGSVTSSSAQNILTVPKRNHPHINLPKRPIIFSESRAKPQAMAKVMPLQNQQTSSSVDDEFRNNFGSESDDCSNINQTELKEVYQSENTSVKTPAATETRDQDETEEKQVANVLPVSRTDLEPDCSYNSETSPKIYNHGGLTNVDQDDQAVSRVLEMGFPEKDIKAALMSLQSRAPGRRHFSVPNLLDEMDKLQEMAEPKSSRANDLDTD
ncbi:uncharacterized protein LOC132557916 isoform X2 [Ylistrum balloti]|nr:uncharacterized protein LOC132557916 isoform X2 [Ylistrum balloti]